MGVPTPEVGYTAAMPRREDHEVHKDMWGYWEKNKTFGINDSDQSACCKTRNWGFDSSWGRQFSSFQYPWNHTAFYWTGTGTVLLGRHFDRVWAPQLTNCVSGPFLVDTQGVLFRRRTKVSSILAPYYIRNVNNMSTRTSGYIDDLGSDM
jgi:hypothetical protein